MEGFILYQLDQYLYPLSLRGLDILDCGCGEGDNALMLAEQGGEITLLDNSTEALNNAANRIVGKKFLVRSILSDIEDWESDLEYDIVLFTNVLHFIPKDKQSKAIDNVLKATKSGGILFFADLVDDEPVQKDVVNKILQNLNNPILKGVHCVYDLPHKKLNRPHKHLVHYIVGIKK